MAVVGNPIIIGGSGGGGGGFTPADEGKVVSNGSLVAQTSLAVTENGTYDTTLNNEVSVSVAGGGGAKNILGGNTAPTSADGSDGDIYIKYTEYSNPPTGYTLLEYLGVESSGAYIDTGVANTANAYFEVDCNWTSAPSNNSGIFGAQISYEYAINAWQGTAFISAGVHANISTPLTRHTLKADASGIYIDSVATGVTPNWSYATGRNYYILANNYNGDVLKASNAKVYSVKLWNGDTLVRDFVPVKRDSDDVLGMYDLVNDVFYTNAGTGSFIAGEELTGTPIDVVYLKVDGSWIILEDGDWDDVNTDGSGGGSTNILTGTTDPSSSQGSNGDIYIKYSDYDDFASGYTALEYIQSSGTQWIDTGVAGNTSNLKIVSDILLTELKGGNGNCLWGANWTIDGYFLVCYQQNLRWHSGGKSVDSTTISSNTWYKITTDKNKLYVGETEYALSSPSGSDASYNVSLLHATNGGSTGYNSSAKLGNTKMYSGDTLLRNFIPAKRNSDDALGMYDTVNNVFYTNAGTDSFSAGNELTGTPIDVVYLKVNGSWIIIEDGEKDDVNTGGSSGGEIQTGTTPPTSSMGSDGDLYKQIFPLASGINFVEYLQSSGTEYINTGITGNQDTGYLYDQEVTIASWAFGARSGAQSRAVVITSDGTSTTADTFDLGSERKTVSNIPARRKMVLKDRKLYINDTLKAMYGMPSDFTTPNPLLLFGVYNGGSVSLTTGGFKLYRAVIYDGIIPIADYLPCLDGNGVPCMWDNISGQYAYNDGTGNFLYGSTATPDPLEAVYFVKENGDWKVI